MLRNLLVTVVLILAAIWLALEVIPRIHID